jgi:hypothetical protein
MTMLEWLWRLLPDRCSAIGCDRKGVRGNENIIRVSWLAFVVCDNCHAKYTEGKNAPKG